ncbi:20044_t:CDS:1, partial [Cetraspora pellucida]
KDIAMVSIYVIWIKFSNYLNGIHVENNKIKTGMIISIMLSQRGDIGRIAFLFLNLNEVTIDGILVQDLEVLGLLVRQLYH